MRPQVMGIVNVTPDSFSDGGRLGSVEAAVSFAMTLIADGADVLDIGGESTRPGADPVSLSDEINRVVPVIAGIRAHWGGSLSIDTMKPEVAREAVRAGATMWNDVTALTYAPDSPAVASELGCDVVLMHMQGAPHTMQVDPHYDEVVAEVVAYLSERADVAIAAGIDRSRIWLDPGIGFGKTLDHNLALTTGLSRLAEVGFPILYAASRKRLIQAIDSTATDAGDRLGGSIALAMEGARRGAAMVRVHDVRQTVQALSVQAALATKASSVT